MKKILLSMLALVSVFNADAQVATNSDLSGNDFTTTNQGFLYSFNNAYGLSQSVLNCTSGGSIWDTFSAEVVTFGVDTVPVTGNGFLTIAYSANTLTSNTRQAANRLTTGNCGTAQGADIADLSGANSTVTLRVKSTTSVKFSVLASSDEGGWKTHDGPFPVDSVVGGEDWKNVTFVLSDTTWDGKGDLSKVIGWELFFAKGQTVDAGTLSIDWIAFGDAIDPNVSASKVVVNALNIYPNPASDQLNVVFDATSISTVQLTDLTGKVVDIQTAKVGANKINFDVATVNAGVYFVNVKNAAGNTAQKVIIK